MSGRRLRAGQVNLYFGKSGSGKSRLALHHLAPFRRVLIFDPNCEPAHASGAWIVERPDVLLRLVASPRPMRICWRGHLVMGGEAFEWANEAAWSGEGFAVFWDEVDRFIPTGRLPPFAYNLVNSGRHRGCVVFAAARRPARVTRDLTAAATRICAGTMTGPTDVAYLREFMGPAADNLAGLERRWFVDWTENGADLKKSYFP